MIAAATSILDPFVIQQAEICASRMVGNYGFSPDDWEDLRQELLLDYLERLPCFDSNRGDLRGFGYGVVRNRAVKLAARRCRSIDHQDAEAHNHRMYCAVVARPDAQLDVRLDVQGVLSRLPYHLQALARQLGEMNLTEVCRQTGKSRSRIHQLIRQIRSAFMEAGVTPEILSRRGAR